MFRAAFLALLPQLAAAHGCDSGRVQCTAVITTEGGVSQAGVGRGAHGSALCTPDGRMLYCLVDHHHHGSRCAEGEVPCCMDGSFPRHESYGNEPASTETPDCKALAADYGDDVEERTGSLLLKIAADVSDILASLDSEKGRDAVAEALAAHTGAKAVSIKEILKQLGSARRLESVEAFSVNFAARGKEWTSGEDLATALQHGFDERSLALTVKEATLKWADVADSDYNPAGAIAATCGAVVLLGAAAFMLRRRYKASAAQASAGSVSPETVGGEDKADMESASTGTGGRSEEASVAGSEPSADASKEVKL